MQDLPKIANTKVREAELIWRRELSISEPTQDIITFFHTNLPRNTQVKHSHATPVFLSEAFPTVLGIKCCHYVNSALGLWGQPRQLLNRHCQTPFRERQRSMGCSGLEGPQSSSIPPLPWQGHLAQSQAAPSLGQACPWALPGFQSCPPSQGRI